MKRVNSRYGSVKNVFVENERSGCKIFVRYVGDNLRSAKFDAIDYCLQYARKLHPNLNFTNENVNIGVELFIDMLVTKDEK